ncbi:ATP-binding protein [Quadrisphaera sp. DSM 44207]|uniref:ATP-binding protein n=1 Tax=Quadrisphaera sp. DSM 44207 TaxID=1881057 RepID=UPI00087FDD9B|nr:ATP-binding protein [Quadrisphaera sp. DSM 44207]SDQ04528.1 Anti-sigma regulatory factor (Ser/Thr protein kinase) [Quadrisphaera sp. DSM 44207]
MQVRSSEDPGAGTGASGTPVRGRFPAVPSSVRLARVLVREVLERHGVQEDLVPPAELLTSELVTNAVRYGGAGALSVRIAVTASEVTVSVSDASRTRPAVGPPREDGGRGLQIVDTLATAWGSEPAPDGKTVWFQLYRTAG